LADDWPEPPAAKLAPLTNPRATPVDAERLYTDRWMFHGPGCAGVSAMGPMGDDGVDGAIDVLPAPGALLDCAGQLMGWWVMQHESHDRLAMPVRIERIALYASDPAPGERVACGVRIRAIGERSVEADLELVAGGKVWAAIDGWEDRRFDSDDAVWSVLMYPELNVLAEPRGAYALVREHWRTAAFEAIAFTPAELAMTGAPREELLTRLWAAKEAVAKAQGTGITDPKRFEARQAGDGRLAIGAYIVDTENDGDYVIAWTRRR